MRTRATIAAVLAAGLLLALAACGGQPAVKPTPTMSNTWPSGPSPAPDVSSPGTSAPPAPIGPPGRANCRKAIKAQYYPHTLKLRVKPHRPAECDGLSTDEVSEIALSVVQENVG